MTHSRALAERLAQRVRRELEGRLVYRLLVRVAWRWPSVASRLPARMFESFWRSPWEGGNEPSTYLVGEESSGLLVSAVQRHAATDALILEVGCNIGRNLHHLHAAGYTRLEGLDISPAALAELRATYPELAAIPLHRGRAQDVLRTVDAGFYDAVFTMVVLTHVHPAVADAVFDEMVRVTKRLLITYEPEPGPDELPHWRHFPRNYGSVFESRGMTMLEEVACDGSDVLRVFTKESLGPMDPPGFEPGTNRL